MDPFVFTDFGVTGNGPASFDLPVYWSPGVGIRWASPVGPIRTTFAQGFTDTSPSHFQFYFNFGEEF
jgi:outer membrane translocation and assembly module TamA